ncbi:MBL fold metallo-hydrolase [Flammeovirga sp. OC4]|uniref:MBL fold metallo-hydrolase n=1 Tax=Flammeovirga sp. OC4 TaxID=1382345 RepID=UPI0005C53760|nr:MBL fold metallo-hydrolase [Flammeovirga sp. OC4]
MLSNFKKQFGGKVTSQEQSKLEKSPQWKNGKFENLALTTMNINIKNIPGLLKKQLTNRAERAPKNNLPILPFNQEVWNNTPETPKCAWYGHSALFLQLGGKNILIDPMLGPDASPIGPITTKRFSENSLSIIDQFPKIDVLMMTHDHYDHLDLASIEKLIPKTNQFIVGLGIKRHLVSWGIDENKITEMDWWDTIKVDNIDITYTPSRHFSGRGLTDRAKSLWGGWVFKTEEHSIYWSGDGGYGEHFKEIGEKLGPFDWGFMEDGQYNENWHLIHMFPEESVQAAIDAKVKNAFPVHWGGFVLALHSWKDPIERFVSEAKKKNQKIFTAPIGKVVLMGQNDELNGWWENHE